MLVLFETPAGFALFKVLDEGKLSNVEVIIILTIVFTYMLTVLFTNINLPLVVFPLWITFFKDFFLVLWLRFLLF